MSKSRPTPKIRTRDEILHVRVFREQLTEWKRAAAKERRTLSSWVADQLDRAIKGEE